MRAHVPYYQLWFGFLLLTLSPLGAAGNSSIDFGKTPEELAMCQSFIYSRKIPGDPNWAHMHHYCDCVRFTNRAYSVMGRDKGTFSFQLDRAMDGCDYVVSHVTSDFDMLPEVHLQMGTIRSLQGQDALAATEYTKAINGNHRLVRAYVGMAEFLTKIRDSKQALSTVTEGLRYNPDSKPLQRMYQRLGGQMPYPPPMTSTEAAPSKKPAKVLASPLASPAVGAEPSVTAGTSDRSPAESQRHIGTPQNPWCRFCPDIPASPPAPAKH